MAGLARTLLAAPITLVLCAAAFAQSTYTNPVIAADFPDPTVLHDSDGMYYAYGTQGGHPMINIQLAQSTDLVHWTMKGDALPTKPAWADQRHNFWAPDVHRFGSTYFMYFAAESNESSSAPPGPGVRGMCIGVATSPHPLGPFTDTGSPLLCGEGFEAIDPMAFDDPTTGKHLLYWGSGFKPIQVQELADDRIHFKPGTKPTILMEAQPGGGPSHYRNLVEGAWVTFHKGWYYLYFSGDNCCGAHPHYAVLVARSRSAFGPFETRGDGILLSANDAWIGPGHNSTVLDAKGQEWIAYHAVAPDPDSARHELARFMLIDRIVYKDGWPAIATGTPSFQPTAAPTIRK